MQISSKVSPPSPRLKSYLLLLSVSVIWGVATPIIKFTLGGIPPLPFLTYRFFISGLLAIICFLVLSKKLPTLIKNLPLATVYGFLATTVALGLLFLGLDRTTVLDSALITATAPLVTAIFGSLMLKESITKREKVGMAIAFMGTLLTILEPALKNGFAFNSTQVQGNLLILGYLIANAVSSVIAKKLNRKDVDSFLLSNYAFLIGFLTILPMTLMSIPLSGLINLAISLSAPYQLGVAFMAIVSGTVGYAMWIRGQKTIEVSEAAVFSYLVPIFASPIAVFWLKETISLPFIMGAVLILIGVVVAETKKARN